MWHGSLRFWLGVVLSGQSPGIFTKVSTLQTAMLNRAISQGLDNQLVFTQSADGRQQYVFMNNNVAEERQKTIDDLFNHAARLFQVTTEQALHLCCVFDWPLRFREWYHTMTRTGQFELRGRLVVRFIREFVVCDGKPRDLTDADVKEIERQLYGQRNPQNG
jgi:hypothetical protein